MNINQLHNRLIKHANMNKKAWGILGDVADWAGKTVGGVTDAVGDAANWAGRQASGVANAVGDAASGVTGAVGDVANWAGKTVGGVTDAVGDAANWAGRQVNSAANAVGDAASQVASDFSDAGSNVVRDIQGRPRIEDERRAAQPQQPVQPTQPQQPVQPTQPQQPVQAQQPVQPKQPVQAQQPNTSFINRAMTQQQQQNPKAVAPNQQTQNKTRNIPLTDEAIGNAMRNGVSAVGKRIANTVSGVKNRVKNIADAYGVGGILRSIGNTMRNGTANANNTPRNAAPNVRQTINNVDKRFRDFANSNFGRALGYDRVYNGSRRAGEWLGNGIATVNNAFGNAAQQVKNKVNEVKAMPSAYGRLFKEFGRGIDSRMDAAATRAQARANDATRSLGAAANNFINTTGRKYLNTQTADKLNSMVNGAQNFAQRGINGLANRFKNWF